MDFIKRLVCLALSLLLLVGCTNRTTVNKETEKANYITGVWISFSELDSMLSGDFKVEFDTAVQNCKARGITDMFVHVRPYCDSYYRSQLFPLKKSAAAHTFDVVEYMINLCHQNGIRFHAWLNPYRVKTADNDVSTLPDSSPAKRWLNDADANNDINVSTVGGVYLNPASSEVRALILDGIREIIDNYQVDGIHFDDYFYPTTDASFDEQSYASYCADTKKPLELSNFRRANVNALISSVYTAIKFKNKDITFSVSPSASIEENHSTHYADVAAWIDNNCVDYIIPQLYFGFEYPVKEYCFETLLSEWKQITKYADTKLLIGLATYKIGTESTPDSTEWINGTDVINRQEQKCKEDEAVAGHVYFSYSSMCKHL